MNQIERKVVIIGGGAAGMAAAVSGAKKVGGSQVCVLEKNSFLGRKLLATGNGRCNFTNINCDKSPQILDFFEELGVLHRVESQGRAYPYTEQAVTVQQALLDEIKGLQIQCICNSVDIHIQNDQDGFDVLVTEKDTGEKWRIKSENLMIATGGKAGVQYGCTGDGYVYAANFGHKLVKPIPSLVQLTCKDPIFKELKGVRSKAFVSLWCDGEKIDGELGEVQFTQEGLSGICIFNISRHLRLSKEVPSYDKFTIVIDLMPQFSLEDVKRRLGADLEKNLKGMIHSKLLPVVLSKAKKMKGKGTLSEKVAQILKGWQIPISGTKSWKEAQVTSGGIPLCEVHLDRMESKLRKNLYFAGEVLDFDGKCGGYNLQWAWETGLLAGNSIR